VVATTPERLRIARELHDGIAQDLVGLGYSLDLILADPQINNSSRAALRKSRLEIDSLISKVRMEILELRRDETPSFHIALRALIAEICGDLETELHLEEVWLDQDAARELLLISQEILRNVLSHARATRLEVNLYPINNRLFIEFFDNGIGGAHMSAERWGLIGVVERLQSIGGELTLESKEGTRISILL
jgi:signal transduction histidine kinase